MTDIESNLPVTHTLTGKIIRAKEGGYVGTLQAEDEYHYFCEDAMFWKEEVEVIS
jgi:hypothetical protein